MDVQAKDRLTGAVILVVLLVLVVPELLSGPERKVVAATAPRSDEPPLRSYTMDLGAPASDPAGAAVPAPTATTPATSAPMAVAAAPPLPAPVVTAPLPATAAPVAASRPSAAAPVTASRPAAAAPAKESVKAPAAAHPPPPATSGAGWTVQLGSFASRANAERLVLDLKAKGFAAFSTESGSAGRKLYRVRVGPPEDHASAEALGAKLRSAGHPGTLTQRP